VWANTPPHTGHIGTQPLEGIQRQVTRVTLSKSLLKHSAFQFHGVDPILDATLLFTTLDQGFERLGQNRATEIQLRPCQLLWLSDLQ
jgi:hypothetical protein